MQALQFLLAPVQSLRYAELLGQVTAAERKRFDASLGTKQFETTAQIRRYALGALVALISGLGQQAQDNVGHHGRNPSVDGAERRGFTRDVAVEPLLRLGYCE